MAAFEYGIVWVGGENGRPHGTKDQGFVQAPHLDLAKVGIDLTGIVIVTGSGTETLAVTTTLVADEWARAELRFGTPASPLVGVATVLSNTATELRVTFTQAASTGTVSGYLVRDPLEVYPEVRVLVPYQPEGAIVITDVTAIPYADETALPIIDPPGFTIPATILKYEDYGLFLEFSFLEGIAAHGVDDVGNDAVSATATTFKVTSLTANLFIGGYLRVTHGATLELQSWARPTSNDGTDFTFTAGWLGSGTPAAGTPADWVWEAWLPHHQNSPHAYTPGIGFRYPNNDMMPAAEGDGRIQNFPKGIGPQYNDDFGAMLEFGWRLSLALGKRINMIYLAVNASTLIPRTQPNMEGFKGTIGWYDYAAVTSDWNTFKALGLAARIEKMIKTIAPAAITAAGDDELRILGIVMPMGEDDSAIAAGRESYGKALTDFLTWLRKVINDATDANSKSLNPYAASAKIPVVHPLITADPWEEVGEDETGLTNLAIGEIMMADGFGATINPEDGTKISGDKDHFDGKGEALIGKLIADEMVGLVSDAQEHGSAIVDDPSTVPLDICNQALAHLGEPKITSLDTTVDLTLRAERCADFYPTARDTLLQEHNWKFAMRRVTLVQSLQVPPSSWVYAYVKPGQALKVVSVLPEGAVDDYAASGQFMPVDFTIEKSESGHELIYTDQPNPDCRYVTRVVNGDRFDDLFRMALSYRLASLLAGVTIKGKEGALTAARNADIARFHIGKAKKVDSQQRSQHVTHISPWQAKR